MLPLRALLFCLSHSLSRHSIKNVLATSMPERGLPLASGVEQSTFSPLKGFIDRILPAVFVMQQLNNCQLLAN